jgi:hypothetical protein
MRLATDMQPAISEEVVLAITLPLGLLSTHGVAHAIPQVHYPAACQLRQVSVIAMAGKLCALGAVPKLADAHRPA